MWWAALPRPRGNHTTYPWLCERHFCQGNVTFIRTLLRYTGVSASHHLAVRSFAIPESSVLPVEEDGISTLTSLAQSIMNQLHRSPRTTTQVRTYIEVYTTWSQSIPSSPSASSAAPSWLLPHPLAQASLPGVVKLTLSSREFPRRPACGVGDTDMSFFSGLPPYHPLVSAQGFDPAVVDRALRADAAHIVSPNPLLLLFMHIA